MFTGSNPPFSLCILWIRKLHTDIFFLRIFTLWMKHLELCCLSPWSELFQLQQLFNLHILRICTVFIFWRCTHIQEPLFAANRKEQIYKNIRGVSHGRVISPYLYVQEIPRKLDVLSAFTIGGHNLNDERFAAGSRYRKKTSRKNCIRLWRKAWRQTKFHGCY